MLITGAIGVSESYFGQTPSTSALLGGVGCVGQETDILSCNHAVLPDCPGQDVASVVCQRKKITKYFHDENGSCYDICLCFQLFQHYKVNVAVLMEI